MTGRRSRHRVRLAANVVILAAITTSAACAVISGLSDFDVAAPPGEGGVTPDGGPIGPDGSLAADTTTTLRDGGNDRAVVDDSPVTVDACTSITNSQVVDLGMKKAAAYPSTRAKTIDGILDDWECETPLILDAMHAGGTRIDGGTAAQVSAKVYAEWDATELYFAWVVTMTSVPGGTNAVTPFLNDSVELHIGGPGALTGNYRPVDRHFITDYKNLSGEYATGSTLSVTGYASAVVVTGNGFVVEMRVDASVVGLVTLSTGTELAFDLTTGRGDGTSQLGQLFWSLANPAPCACTATCCCGTSDDQPACDTRRWGGLELR